MNKQISIFEEEDKKALQEQINQFQIELDYDTRDYPINYINSLFNEGEIYAPSYQREQSQWDIFFKSRFIESLILNYPIPMLFLADNEDGKMEIIDGLQRISTIAEFLGVDDDESSEFELDKLTKIPLLNGKVFAELPDSERRRLKNKALRVIVLKKTTPEDARRELFDRLNTSSLKAKPSEVRYGREENNELMRLIVELSQNSDFIETTNLSKQMLGKKEDYELIARFFAYSYNRHSFKGRVANFVDEYISSAGKEWTTKKKTMFTQDFNSTMKFVNENFERGFQKEDRDQTPHVRFEAIAVGVNLALKKKPDLKIKKERLSQFLLSDDFKDWTTTDAANNRKKVLRRIEGVRDALLEICDE
ncbi:DUF262 domain-containing protein [Lactococcus cremoris]|uniref:DUF262 domain-containing protein n=1 Tax=Lactococcus lactis subsp. cremoris TaxID=1359 RepID=UPI0003AB9743|nr:DUF262 domain-containing protein [Lactococcus cremoris]AGV74225.1 hypothetical protein kw2_2296 [Lactococcus cremoris subsp. cremoris KW2]